jgi:Fe-S oxidoreductase
MGEIVTDDTFSVGTYMTGTRRALLINPPVYDAQYWARWSQPAGLLRIATLLQQRGYAIDFVDCMETDVRGLVKKTMRSDVDGKPLFVKRDDIVKRLYHFGLSLQDLERRLHSFQPPDEIWITSIMTYWWESTRDVVMLAKRLFPHATVLVGGIYPTLAPEHALENLGADVIFKGELRDASQLPTDLTLYAKSPSYAILATSRGCPWDCVYCAARTLNGGAKVRTRTTDDILEEVRYKYTHLGIRRFGFYEDNALINREHFIEVMEAIIASGLPLDLYAPEGFETRLLDEDVLRLMKRAGFEKIHLPLETVRSDINRQWNRRHSSTESFERALEAAIRAGFKPRTQEINAFVLFGLPDENLKDVVDSTLYAHHLVGSVIPMLFSPVPSTQVFRKYSGYLLETMEWDLQDLNGKFLPFLEYNRRSNPGLRASDYLELEGLMSILNNGKVLSRAVDLCDDTMISRAFQTTLHAKRTSLVPLPLLEDEHSFILPR